MAVFRNLPYRSVNVDNYIGLYQAVDYLYKRGIAGRDTSKATCPLWMSAGPLALLLRNSGLL